jgi:potassium-transporting ATPase KdpC subunit
MRKDIITSAIGMLVLTLVCGLAYPLLVTGISQVAFHGNANGQQVFVDGKLVGSKIIGQAFTDAKGNPLPQYFQSRPSGTDPADNDAGTEFANYGPNSVITEKAIAANVKQYIALNGKYYPGGLNAGKVPVDAADTSASGVDPDISVLNADIQAYRIDAVRHLPLATVHGLISKYTSGRGLGFSGEPGVDVLELNLALNRLRTNQ